MGINRVPPLVPRQINRKFVDEPAATLNVRVPPKGNIYSLLVRIPRIAAAE